MLSAFHVVSFGAIPGQTAASSVQQQSSMGQRLTRMSLSPYDGGLAKQFMDKDGDGKCDVCGMDVQVCMDSGQIQCNMDSKSTIGILGSQHMHADWKIYINGRVLGKEFFGPLARDTQLTTSKITSSFIHVEHSIPEQANLGENLGDVIHMHATGVPLWIFLKSVGMDFNKDCLMLQDGQKFCNSDGKTLKFYVNGKPNDQWENYVFNNLDKILISYGTETDLSQQLNSITDFAKNH